MRKYKIYYITSDTKCPHCIIDEVQQVLETKRVAMVELKNNKLPVPQLCEVGIELKHLLESNKIPFIINNKLELVLCSKADGLHLEGYDAMPPDYAKFFLKNKIIGFTVASPHQLILPRYTLIDFVLLDLRGNPTKLMRDLEGLKIQKFAYYYDGLHNILKYLKIDGIAIHGLERLESLWRHEGF